MLNDTGLEKEPSDTNKENTVELPSGENADPSSLLRSNCSVDSEVLGLDKITSENPKKGQKKTEEPKKKDEDDDYEPKLTPDSESDEDFSEPDESDEEEFTVKKTSKTKKKEKISKSEKPKTSPAANKAKRPSKPSKSKSAASTPVRSPPSAKPAPRRSVSSSAVPTSKPSVSVSPAGGRVPKWNPPAQIGKSPTSCQRPAGPSPGQGLRLGLSRLVRVKPLHPSVASH
uniref:RAD51 associated protein 1 n=1 Tax=Salarias fasciatus TaxID=181472 RepID=A0A672HGD8_SALFA